MKKSCIIIDNDDQTAEIEKLVRDGAAKGIKIDCQQFNVGSTFDDELLTNGEIDIAKVAKAFRNRFNSTVFHLAAFDWDLSDPKIDGVELIRQLTHNKILKNTPKLLYSGLLEDKLSSKIDDYKNDTISRKVLVDTIKVLINADIKGFVPRENYDLSILNALEKTDETMDLIIEAELAKYPELMFSGGVARKSFNGKTFLEVSKLLENDDLLRNEFKRDIIQEVIAHLTERL